MKTYRVLEENGNFYPQYKNGWKTFWCWYFFEHGKKEEQTFELYDDGFLFAIFLARFSTLKEAIEYIWKKKNPPKKTSKEKKTSSKKYHYIQK